MKCITLFLHYFVTLFWPVEAAVLERYRGLRPLPHKPAAAAKRESKGVPAHTGPVSEHDSHAEILQRSRIRIMALKALRVHFQPCTMNKHWKASASWHNFFGPKLIKIVFSH